MSQFWIGLLFGVFNSIPMSILAWCTFRKYLRAKRAMANLIRRMYHSDLLPEICRVEGLIDILNTEFATDYSAKALQEIRTLKRRVTILIKQYEPFQ